MADPMTPERLAEIREREQAAPIGPWLHVRGFPQALHNGGDDILAEFYQDIDAEPTAARFVAAARQDVPALLAEVERLRTELRDRRTDDLDIRGILKPAPGVGDPAVPMPLGPALAPAIEWLVNDRDRLRLQLESAEQERDAARGVAKGRTELADQMRTERDAAREQAERVRALHYGVCHGACGLDDACECEERDLVCAECNDRYPCPTRRCLDGTEADR